jgi:hypothetical protein
MNNGFRVVALVAIAVFAFTAITAVPILALVDAETPVAALFNTVRVCVPLPDNADVPLRIAPPVDVRSPRPPPLSQRS